MANTIQTAFKLIRNVATDESNRGERLKRLAALVGWQLWKRTIAKPITVKLFNGYLFIAHPNDDTASSPIYFRVPDFREITFIRQYLCGGTMLDIGANVGLVTLLLADKINHAVLFEPNPLAAERARENLALNHLDFQVVEEAVSDETGTVTLEDRGGTDSRNRTIVGNLKSTFPLRIVPRTTVDDFLATRLNITTPISFIKIDVEGHENAVLRGMQHCLVSSRPMVMFEYLMRTKLEETRKLFRRVDYLICELNGTRPVVVSKTVHPLQNLFAFPREHAQKFGVLYQDFL